MSSWWGSLELFVDNVFDKGYLPKGLLQQGGGTAMECAAADEYRGIRGLPGAMRGGGCPWFPNWHDQHPGGLKYIYKVREPFFLSPDILYETVLSRAVRPRRHAWVW